MCTFSPVSAILLMRTKEEPIHHYLNTTLNYYFILLISTAIAEAYSEEKYKRVQHRLGYIVDTVRIDSRLYYKLNSYSFKKHFHCPQDQAAYIQQALNYLGLNLAVDTILGPDMGVKMTRRAGEKIPFELSGRWGYFILAQDVSMSLNELFQGKDYPDLNLSIRKIVCGPNINSTMLTELSPAFLSRLGLLGFYHSGLMKNTYVPVKDTIHIKKFYYEYDDYTNIDKQLYPDIASSSGAFDSILMNNTAIYNRPQDKIRWLYNYISNKHECDSRQCFVYDLLAVVENKDRVREPNVDTILQYHKGTCQQYALLFEYGVKVLSIPDVEAYAIRTIEGRYSHTRNVVNLRGQYYYVEPQGYQRQFLSATYHPKSFEIVRASDKVRMIKRKIAAIQTSK